MLEERPRERQRQREREGKSGREKEREEGSTGGGGIIYWLDPHSAASFSAVRGNECSSSNHDIRDLIQSGRNPFSRVRSASRNRKGQNPPSLSSQGRSVQPLVEPRPLYLLRLRRRLESASFVCFHPTSLRIVCCRHRGCSRARAPGGETARARRPGREKAQKTQRGCYA